MRHSSPPSVLSGWVSDKGLGSAPRHSVDGAEGVKISELAKHLGTTVRTLRYYEEAGLLTPLRTAGNARVYGPQARAQAEKVLGLVALGIRGEDIRQILTSPEAISRVLLAERLREGLAALDERRARVVQALEGLVS